MAIPDYEWADVFGDKLKFFKAGNGVVLGMGEGDKEQAVLLSPEQIRGLRNALAAHAELHSWYPFRVFD